MATSTTRFDGPVTLAGGLTIAGNLTQTGDLAVSGSVTAARIIQSTADVVVTDAIYTVAAGVTGVDGITTGAGTYAITLGANNDVGHIVTVYASAISTGTFTIADAKGTTTLDAANECATFRYDGTSWRCISFIGTLGPL